MMRALKCACGLGVEGGHRIANWLLEGSGPDASQLRIEALFSVGASAKKGAQWAREPRKTETQSKASPLPLLPALPSQGQRKNKKPLLEKSTNAARHQDSRGDVMALGMESSGAQGDGLAASGREKKSAKCKRQPTNETRRGKTKVFPLLFRLSPPQDESVGLPRHTPRASC